METIRHKGVKVHMGCGGEVVKGRCIKCGTGEERKGLGKKIFGEGPLIIRDKDIREVEQEAHRKRIREGRDIIARDMR